MQHEDTSHTTDAKPLQVGEKPGEIEGLIERISHSGVAQSEADVEEIAGPNPRAGIDEDTDAIPVVTGR